MGAPIELRFADFEVSVRSGELRRNGVKIKLQEQPFQILVLLLKQRGEVVSRDELRKKLWTSDTFVDFDNGLNIAMKKLRTALGDDPDTPRSLRPCRNAGIDSLHLLLPTSSGAKARVTSLTRSCPRRLQRKTQPRDLSLPPECGPTSN